MKSQGAMEYLTTYGWAIVIVMVVIAALYSLGIFNLSTYQGNQCVFSSQLNCAYSHLGANGVISLTLQQEIASTINITAIGCNQNSTTTNLETFTGASQIELPLGAVLNLTSQCYTNNGSPFSGVTGSTYDGYIVINYVEAGETFNRTTVGRVVEKVFGQGAVLPTSIPTTSSSTTIITISSTSTTISSTTTSSSTTTTSIAATTTILLSLSPSTGTIDATQSVSFTNETSGGSGPYTYSYTISPTTGTVRSGNTITFGDAGTFNIFETATDTLQSSAYSSNSVITVAAAPYLFSMTPSNVVLSSGQYVTYNIVLSNGIGPFTVNLVNVGTGYVVNTIIWTTPNPNANIITFGANIPAIGTQTFNVVAIDMGPSTPYSILPPSTNTITISAPSITGCGTLPSSITSLILYCYPANVVNTQTSTTPTNFQQEFNSLPFNALAGNVVVYNSISGMQMPAWVESNSIIWVNLGSNTIAGSSSANGIYYFGLGSSGTNFFLNGNNIGEAPQLSASYAAYDNGNTVFFFYDDFKGSTINTNLWTVLSSSSYALNNGLQITSGGSGAGNSFLESIPTFNTNVVVDMYRYATISNWFGFDVPGTYANGGVLFYDQDGWRIYSGGSSAPYSGSESTYVWYILGGAVTSSAQAILYVNYIPTVSSSTSYFTNTNGNLYLGASGGTGYVDWVRVRIYPPNGVMPSVNYGDLEVNQQ